MAAPARRPTVGIDARVLFRNRRGIGNVLHNLLLELAVLDRTTRYLLLTDTQGDRDSSLPDNFEIVAAPPRFYPLWEQVVLPLMCVRHRIDLLHCPANTGPMVVPARTTLVLTIHDLINFSERYASPSDSVFKRAARFYSRLVIPRVARMAAEITTVSQFTRDDILATLEGVPAQRVSVIPNAESFAPLEPGAGCPSPAGEPESPFFLCLGAVDPRKNTARTVSAFLRCADRLPARTSLVVAGLQQVTPEIRELLDANKECAPRVRLCGYVPDAELSQLFRACIGFLYLSRSEGFGMPLVDAMRHDCPIICGNATSIPEVVGTAAIMVDPDDERAIGDAMARVATGPALRAELVARGRAQREQFRWSASARRLLEVYRGAMSRGRRTDGSTGASIR